MIIIAIDAGVSNGGVAVMLDDGTVRVYPMKRLVDAKEFMKLINYLTEIDTQIVAYVEKQSLRKGEKPEAMFGLQKLFDNYNMCLNLLRVGDVAIEIVHPRTWQAQMRLNIDGKREELNARKNRYKEAAKHYFPEITVTHWNADALLILEYGRRLMRFAPKVWKLKKNLFE